MYYWLLNSIYNDPDLWKEIVVISDPMTPNYLATTLIVPSLADGAKSDGRIKTLSGKNYLLTRAKSAPKKIKLIENNPLMILVNGGGSDPFYFSDEIAKIIDELEIQKSFEVHFFSNRKIISTQGNSYFTHKFGSEFDEFAKKCDLAFTTASTGSLELLVLGKPIGIVAAVDNQKANYAEMDQLGYAVGIGELDSQGNWKIEKLKLKNLIEQNSLREALRERIAGLFESDGPAAILNEILSPNLI